MTITAQTSKTGPYSGNGTTTVFSYTFRVQDEAHLVVTVLGTDGITESTKTLNTDYTVTGVGNTSGGTVVMAAAPAVGEKLTITRLVPLDQEIDLQNRGAVNPETLEQGLDKLTQIAQDQQEQLDRSLKVDLFDQADLDQLTLNVNSLAAIENDISTVAGISTDVTTVAGIDADVTTVAVISTDVTAVAAIDSDVSTVAAYGADIGIVAGLSTEVAALGPISADISTVSGISADVTAVAADAADIGTVSANITNVNTVAGVSADVTTVAGISADVTAVASDAADIGTVAGISTDVATVAGISADVTAVAADAADIGTVSTNITDVNTVAGISANVTTVAGISADVTAVAADAADIGTVSTNITDVGTVSTNIANVNTVAGLSTEVAALGPISDDISTVAANVADLTNYADTYLGPKTSDPALRNDGSSLQEGDLYFNTADDVMKVYGGAAWLAAYASLSGALLSANNLSDVANVAAARTNLGLGTAATTASTDYVNVSGDTMTGDLTIPDKIIHSGDTDTAIRFPSNDTVTVETAGSERLRIDASGNVGIGTSSPTHNLDVVGVGDTAVHIIATSSGAGNDDDAFLVLDAAETGEAVLSFRQDGVEKALIEFFSGGGPDVNFSTVAGTGANFDFQPEGNLALRINSSGDVKIFGNNTTTDTRKFTVESEGYAVVTINGDISNTSDEPGGAALQLAVDGTGVNGIVSYIQNAGERGDGSTYTGTATNSMLVGTTGNSAIIFGVDNVARLRLNTGNLAPITDNAFDLGGSSTRYDDIYATNGTIQTSDRNEKQQIAELTTAEMQAATTISKLFKTFKWNDSVVEKGDDARIHTGVIAQEVEAAMADAGLDAGQYAFFISSTWWESTEVIPAVEEVLDEEGNVVTEAQAERTVTHTHETAEEAPEGAVERTRKGIRYPQLLSFIGAATEQRLTSIEARITALEAQP